MSLNALMFMVATSPSQMEAVDLRCNDFVNPIGVSSAKPELSWRDQALNPGVKNLNQSSYQVIMGRSPSALGIWDSGKVESAETYGIPFSGPSLTPNEVVYWKVRVWDQNGIASKWSQAASFEVGLNSAEWVAKWIAMEVPKHLEPLPGTDQKVDVRPATYYRTDFAVTPHLVRATAYITALGLIDLHLNGKRINEDLFTPGWTDYQKRVYSRAYDVTRALKPGANTIGAVLGDGWYSGYIGYARERAHYGDHPRARVQLDLAYSDGHHETVATSSAWKASTGGVLRQDFLHGESFDATKEPWGWDRPGFNALDWANPTEVTDVTARVQPHPGPPVRPFARLKPISITQRPSGAYVLNFGQNLAGFAQLKMQGNAGEQIKIRYAERLAPNGDIYTDNLRSAQATDSYTFKGGQVETWSPRFTFHGFQYMELTGLSHAPSPDEIEAVAISSATPEVGKIETSDPLINKLASNAWWTQKMNFIDVPTDCPQRDERLGWTGDAQVYISTACRYSDVEGFFRKWITDLDDAQAPNGDFPMVAPLKVADQGGGPAWADAGVICPWTIYEVYGNKAELAKRYEAMKRYVDFYKNRSTPDLLPPKNFHCFGDWVSINADTPHEVIYEAYFALSSRMVAEAAAALGKTDDARAYSDLSNRVRAAFRKAYVSPDGVVQGDTQCGYVLAISFDLLDSHQAALAADRLVADIKSRGWHLSTGFVGTRDILYALSKAGRNDVAFRLLHNKTFPSWGFQIANGATSIWERWDGWTPDKGFQDPGMNSFAHYAYGSVMGWVYDQIGGIHATAPGYSKVLIAPQLDPNLQFAKTHYDSIRGPIITEWKRLGNELQLSTEIPANEQAEIRVPVKPGQKVLSPSGLLGVPHSGYESYSVGSGKYVFKVN